MVAVTSAIFVLQNLFTFAPTALVLHCLFIFLFKRWLGPIGTFYASLLSFSFVLVYSLNEYLRYFKKLTNLFTSNYNNSPDLNPASTDTFNAYPNKYGLNPFSIEGLIDFFDINQNPLLISCLQNYFDVNMSNSVHDLYALSGSEAQTLLGT